MEPGQKEQEMLEAIRQWLREKGYPPTVREVGAMVHLSSPSTVHGHLHRLEQMGYIRRDDKRNRSITLTEAGQRGIPLVGRVAAGMPILAGEEITDYIPWQPKEAGTYFALTVRGDSMVGAGILSGDTVVVRQQDSAQNGEIVIALLGEEATCKRLKYGDGEVWLLPENPEYPPIDGRSARILGKVTAVIRTYEER